MDTAFALNLDDRAELTVVEAANLIWKWREHRNRAFWNALYVWGTVAIAIAIIPYIVPGLPARLGLAVLIFPLLACLLSLFAAYLSAVLYRLYKQVDRKYRELLGGYNPEDLRTDTLVFRLLTISMGKVVAFAFLFFGAVAQFCSALVLLQLARAG